jgi:hypothetical protein
MNDIVTVEYACRRGLNDRGKRAVFGNRTLVRIANTLDAQNAGRIIQRIWA